MGVLYERMTAADIEALAEEADSAAPAKDAEAAIERARRRTQERAIARLTEEVDGRTRFKSKPSVLAPHVKNLGEFRRIAHEGERIVRGQKLMQAVSDLFLGWADGLPGTGLQFYGRQLHDMKGAFTVEAAKVATIELYADLCARTLARAHARSGDTAAIAAYLDDGQAFADAVEVFAVAESHFVVGDHKRLTDAIAAGELEAADTDDA